MIENHSFCIDGDDDYDCDDDDDIVMIMIPTLSMMIKHPLSWLGSVLFQPDAGGDSSLITKQKAVLTKK